MVWYEPASNLGKGLVEEYEAAEVAEAEADAAAEREEAELAALEAEEAMAGSSS